MVDEAEGLMIILMIVTFQLLEKISLSISKLVHFGRKILPQWIEREFGKN